MSKGGRTLNNGVELVIRPDPFGDPKGVVCFFRVGDFRFPSEDWIDLAGVPGMIEEQLKVLHSEGYCEFWFLDGPYQVNVTSTNEREIELEFVKRDPDGDSIEYSVTLPRRESVEQIKTALEEWQRRKSAH